LENWKLSAKPRPATIVIKASSGIAPLTTPKKQAARKKVALHLEEYVPGLLAWLSNKLAASASQAYRQQFGLGIVEWRILAYLAVYDWGTGAQMSQLMGMDKAAISRGASFLQTKKFIKSRAGFGRNLEFGLTAKGHEIHDRIIRLALARQDALLSGLSKKDVAVLISHLHVLLNNLPSVDAIENGEY
jgi:DNA-binding MarR family transcriptional regulator